MKRIIFLFLFVLPVLLVKGQDEKLDKGEEMGTILTYANVRSFVLHCYEQGVYLNSQSGFTRMNKELGFVNSFSTGFYVNPNFSLGYFSQHTKDDFGFRGMNMFGEDDFITMDMKTWGIVTDYTFFPTSAVHFSVPLFIGGGRMRLETEDVIFNSWDFEEEDYDFEDVLVEKSPYFMIQPGLVAEINLVAGLKLRLGASYRAIVGTDLFRLSDENLTDLSIDASLRYNFFQNKKVKPMETEY